MRKIIHALSKITRPFFYILSLGILILFVWILWKTYQADNFGFESKTYWDWMELLVVPLALAIAGYWLAKIQKQTELEIAKEEKRIDREIAREVKETELEIALERQRQQTLENYLDRMKELILDRNLTFASSEIFEERRLARTLTLNVLRELTAKRNRQVVQFLQELELITWGGEHGPILDLSRAELSNSDLRMVNLEKAFLRGIFLEGANLEKANLIEADLSPIHEVDRWIVSVLEGVNLDGARLHKANLDRGILKRASLRGANLKEANLSYADLENANLSNAILINANLRGTTFYWANMVGANFIDTDLSGAYFMGGNMRDAELMAANLRGVDLTGVKLHGADFGGANLENAKLSEEQFKQAVFSDSTIMPDGKTHLEWELEQRHRKENPVGKIQSQIETPPDISKIFKRISKSSSEGSLGDLRSEEHTLVDKE